MSEVAIVEKKALKLSKSYYGNKTLSYNLVLKSIGGRVPWQG